MDFIVTLIYVILIFTRPQEWIPLVSSLKMVDLTAAASILVVAYHLLPKGSGKNVKTFFLTPQVLLVLMIWVWMTLVYASKGFISEVIDTFGFMGKKVLLFALIALTVNTVKRLKVLINTLFVCFIILGLHCTLQQVTGAGLGGLEPAIRAEGVRVRAFGTFEGSNEIGGITAFAIILSCGFLVKNRKSPLLFIFFAATAGWMLMVLFWTQSRQALINLAGGLFGLFMPRDIRWMIVSATLAIGVFAVLSQFHGRWSSGLDDGSAAKRVQLITHGLKVFTSNPVFGVGTDRSYQAVGLKQYLHNSFLIMVVENGFPGLMIYVSLFSVTFLQLNLMKKATPENVDDIALKGFAPMLTGLILSLLVSSYFTNRPYHTDAYVYWGVFAAYCRLALITAPTPGHCPPLFRSTSFIGKNFYIPVLSGVALVAVLHFTSRAYHTMV